MHEVVAPRDRVAGPARAIRTGILAMLVVLSWGCAKKEAPPPAFSLDAALPSLVSCALDESFLFHLDALKGQAARDPALAAPYVRFALAGLASGLSTGSPALARMIGGEARDPAVVGRYLAAVAEVAKGAPAPLPAAVASMAAAWNPGKGDLAAALAFAASDAEAAPAFRALVARKVLDGLRKVLPSPETERGRLLQEAIPGLPTPMAQDPRGTVFPSLLRLLDDLLQRGAGAEKGLAGVFQRHAQEASSLLGPHAFPVPVSTGPDPRPGTPLSGVPGAYLPLLALTLDADGAKAGVRPTFGWNEGRVADLSADPGYPGAVAVASSDLPDPKGPALDAGKAVVATALKAAEALEPRAFQAGAGTGMLSVDRGERGRPALVLARGDRPAPELKTLLAVAAAANVTDLRLVPPGSAGRVLPAFYREPPVLPGIEAPKGPRVLVVLTPAGADVHPPAKASLPIAGWPEGVQAVPEGKRLFRLSVPWVADKGFSGKVAEAVGAIRAKARTAPAVDVVIRAKDVTAAEIVDAAAEILAAPGDRYDLLPVYFPGVSCAQGGACPSAVPVLFSDAAVPKGGKAQTVMVETRPSGFCEKGAVQRVVMGRSGAYRACYEAELQRYGNLAGRLELRFTIEPDGSVSGITTSVNELTKGVEACIVRQVSQLKFPKPDGGICIIRWPFSFKPGG